MRDRFEFLLRDQINRSVYLGFLVALMLVVSVWSKSVRSETASASFAQSGALIVELQRALCFSVTPENSSGFEAQSPQNILVSAILSSDPVAQLKKGLEQYSEALTRDLKDAEPRYQKI